MSGEAELLELLKRVSSRSFFNSETEEDWPRTLERLARGRRLGLLTFHEDAHRRSATACKLTPLGLSRLAHKPPPPPRTHAVLLIPGIRTQAEWQDHVKAELEDGDPTIHGARVGYGFFDFIRFSLPFDFIRMGPLNRVWKQIRDVAAIEGVTKVSVIAHSFGSFAFYRFLESREPENQRVKLHRLIVCGSIIRRDFDWEKHASRFSGKEELKEQILNDCGTKDIWPVMAGLLTTDYGPGGRLGFQHHRAFDRYHPFGHSGFFKTEGFARVYWVPFLSRGEVVPSGHKRKTTSLLISVATRLPSIYQVGVILLVAAVAYLVS